MTKSEFIKEAADCGYSQADIAEMVEMVESARKDGIPMEYDTIILTEQPRY